ncbi:TIGR00180 family glycosyltransferase [Laspinema olomoucense]|uniref:TIGR00180 family glycosyltransferase n=1 Tax=Laspinema olomoucense TaxID=3231600 RepID=UPI0021BA9C86|nr:TIGR00180 family glycosyltransferase [Laspinema sp. D3c]MCT7995219.1 TIGR00180 family glycosyltransferase [Laspinema sp. D3c]
MITILIFSYNRPKFLLRQIEYWSNYPNFKLLIIDGSPVPLDLSILNTVPDNLTYIHNSCSIFERIQLGLAQVSTPYVILHADDEFYLPNALKQCASFLEQNSTYSVVSGVSVGFNYYDKIVVGYEGYKNWNHHLCHSNGVNRLVEHFGRYSPDTIYGLWRTSDLKIAIKYASRFPWSCGYVGELLVEAYACLSGKTKTIPYLQWLRSSENPPIDYGVNRSLTYEVWTNKYNNEFQLYLETLSNMIAYNNSIATDISPPDQAKMIHNSYVNFSRYYYNKNSSSQSKLYLAIKSFFMFLFPRKALEAVKNKMRKKIRKYDSLLQTAKQLEESNIYVDYEELKKVEEVIVDFYK